ncbi:IclR family transcriptional regulator [Nocardia cyriacigeorgica]|uniref:IclR family transcriptional regulator n=1 Tax=Nocardia cyriacigeorgica TaxID=135487 RepID=A0A6P1CTZ6_9NOCA|nr:IclR family transcriptional regulator [Nocardia cyriacigeorgica]NEW36030.1 IclR family transcriptional regulator [Nocardia cyriacigeorgica]
MRNDRSQDAAHTLNSVANALRVLTLTHEEGAVTLPLISERLEVGKSTAHRLVSTLIAEKFLQRSPTRNTEFIVGPTLLEIGATALRKADIRRHARRPMERLCDQLGETVSLVVHEGSSTRVVDGVESKQAIRVGLRTGVVLPANATAAGKVLLAYLPEKSLVELFPQGLPALTAETKATWPELKQQLAQVRANGFAYSAAESEPHLNGLAVPVRDHAGEVVAALAIAAPHYRLPLHTARARVRFLDDTAAAITRALG